MASCTNRIKANNRKICIGDLKHRINVQARIISPPAAGGVDYQLSLLQMIELQAMIQTKRGVEIFDGTNLLGVATHYFYIRYMPDLSIADIVEYNGIVYTILDIENLDEQNDFILLRCSKRGASNNPVNFSGVP